MKRVVLIGLVLALGGAFAVLLGVRFPGSGAGTELDGRQQMNADNALKLLGSPDVGTFALPAQFPAGLDFLTAVRTGRDGLEIAVQHREGIVYMVCDGAESLSCDEPSVDVVRTELVDGRSVQVGRIDRARAGEAAKAAAQSPTEADEMQALDFWLTVELVRGTTPVWLSDLAQGQEPGDHDPT